MPKDRSRTIPLALADRLHSAAVHLLRRVRASDEETGLSPARLSLLSVLVFGDERWWSPGDLARAEQVTPPTITALLKALEADGYVRRRPDPEDGRGSLVAATAKARRLLRRARRARLRGIQALLGDVPARERLALERVAGLLEERLGREA